MAAPTLTTSPCTESPPRDGSVGSSIRARAAPLSGRPERASAPREVFFQNRTYRERSIRASVGRKRGLFQKSSRHMATVHFRAMTPHELIDEFTASLPYKLDEF